MGGWAARESISVKLTAFSERLTVNGCEIILSPGAAQSFALTALWLPRYSLASQAHGPWTQTAISSAAGALADRSSVTHSMISMG
jgi:hypothetical protein